MSSEMRDSGHFTDAFELAQILMGMSPDALLKCPIRVHGNGFIQMDLQGPDIYDLEFGARLHIWDRSLELGQKVRTPIHDHRFDFESVVLVGALSHTEFQMAEDPGGNYQHWVAMPRDREDTVLVPEERRTLYKLGEKDNLVIPVGHGYDFLRYRFHESVSLAPVTATVMVKTGVDENHRPKRVAVPYNSEPDNRFNRYQYPPGVLRESMLNALQLARQPKSDPALTTVWDKW